MAELIRLQHTGSTEYMALTRRAVSKARFGRGALRQVMAQGIETWIKDNCNDLVVKQAGDFWFMDLGDALAFKIVWGGR